MIDITYALVEAGVQGLRDTPKEIVGRCPGHLKRTGKEDAKPSWSINKELLVHFCFSCGYSGTLRQLLIDLTGSAPVDLEIEMNRQSFLARVAVREDAVAVVDPIISEWAIDNYLTDMPEKMMQRRCLRRSALDAHKVRYNRDTRQIVMPIWGATGNLIGAQYKQVGSVLTLPEGMAKSEAMFGYHLAKQSDYAALVESPLDAVRLTGLGIPAVSTLGAWVSREQVTMMARNFSYVVLALDNDKTGREAAAIVKPMLKKQGCTSINWDYTGLMDKYGEPAKDVGDVPDDGALLDAFTRTRTFGL